MLSRMRWMDWGLWLQWVAATVVGSAGGLGLGRMLEDALRHAIPAPRWLTTSVVLGVFLGFTQWLVLRARLPRAGWWIPATIVASPLFWLGPWVGLWQWLALRIQVPRSGWWIVGCIAAWSPAAAAAEGLSRIIGDRFVILGGFMGLVAGAATGFTLVWLLPSSEPVRVPARSWLTYLTASKELARLAAVGTLAGLIPGLCAGLGARLAMRIAGALAGPEAQGKRSLEGVVGQVALGSSAFVVLIGALTGALGGLLYVSLRRWVPCSGFRKGLAFGFLLLLMTGPIVLRAENADFNRWGPPSLNIGMFSSLFILFGLLVAPLADRLDRSIPAPSLRIKTLAAYAALIVILCPVAISAAEGVLDGGAAMGRYGYLVIVGILLAAAAAFLVRGGTIGERPKERRLGYAVLGILCLVGLVLDVRAIVGILAAGGR